MQIGIIGVGSISLNFAQRAAKSGHEVLISNIGNNSPLKEIVRQMGSNAKLVSTTQAATAGLIILFSPSQELETLLKNLPDMSEKTIMHTSNPIFNLNSFATALKPDFFSLTMASLMPAADIVKIYNMLGGRFRRFILV
jgi:predicted dinucleotide-binding enzyme